jgi:hypothetical protein
MRHAILLLSMVALTTGCHARLEKLLPTVGEVYPEVCVVHEPHVQLGSTSDQRTTGDVVALTQSGREASLTRELTERLDANQPAEELRVAIVDGVRGARPVHRHR